jgi:predicted amidohydrolase
VILNVALLQMASASTDQAANLQKGETFCRRAKAQGADIALFPEMWNIGYSFYNSDKPGDQKRWENEAINQASPFFTHFQNLAAELEMAIAITYLEQWPGAPRNTISIIDRSGQIILTYAKIHTCDFDKEIALTPGDDFYVSTLETTQGPVQVGAMICFDREFPESARLLMLKGAEIILTPNACELENNRLCQFRVRAFENMCGMAMANYARPQSNGHSTAHDGIAFEEACGSRDTTIILAGEEEGIYLAPFDIERLRRFRQTEGWGNAYRKPSRYTALCSAQVNPPFVRPDARR